MNEVELKRRLKLFHRQLNILREREARYGGNAPLDLLNQINDYQTAIGLVESRLAGEISDEVLEKQLAPLTLSSAGGRTEIISGTKIQIGTLVIPALPLLGLLFLLVAAALVWGWSQLGPTEMPGGSFNVVVAEIGQKDANGQVHSSEDGKQLSRWIFTELKNEYKDLPQNSEVTVWHDSLGWTEKRIPIGVISSQAEAAVLARKINANLVIYGNLVAGENTTSFVPEFYVTQLRGEADEIDEISGPYQLGAPIPLNLPLNIGDPVLVASLKPEVSLRARALRWFTMGFIWDLAGKTATALKTFQQAEKDLADWGERRQGKEILYYFIGREILFLSRNEEEVQKVFTSAEEARTGAEKYFRKALDSNPDYARAYMGLGGVFFQRARSAPSPEQNLALAESAIAQYKLALANARKLPGEQVALEARFGLAVAYQLKGDTYYKLGHYDEAVTYLDGTIREIRAILEPMMAAQQHRSLGHAYVALGAAYAEQAIVRQNQDDKTQSIALYKKAEEAYIACIAQGDAAKGGNPYDELLKNMIDTYCRPYAGQVSKNRLALEEGQ